MTTQLSPYRPDFSELLDTEQVFLVGGAVRDSLLGLPVTEHDWVVTGYSPAHMEAAGFRAVGKDFPVFLHPQTQEEYALARTERKTAKGYKGFSISASEDVTPRTRLTAPRFNY